MIVLILSIILIGLAGLERSIYIKKNKGLDKVRLFIGVLITCLLFLISYIITDTAIGVLYVFLSTITFILISIVNDRSNVEWLKYSSYVVGLPFMVYLLIKAIQNMLIHPQYFLLLLLVINTILCFTFKRKGSVKENIALAIGIVIAATFMFSYYKLSGSEGRIMVKQELVAQKYLEEELDMHGLEVYSDNFFGSIRGQETKVKAYDSSGTFILMTYKNNKIVSYDVKDR
ncbi:hypothetical protein [Proteiniborus sp.]|uniref:hypothetical protein n=1 Tax=Proteiniborus sp. TaxID=2079015 RepID=UPI0033239316